MVGMAMGPLAGLALAFFYAPDPAQPLLGPMAGIAACMAILWITEALPLAATALMPLVLFPLAGILDGGSTAKAYINSIIFLFIGGFMIALAMQRWNLHRRIALLLIYWIGRRADLMILGFMAASAFLSMWISNTATAIMMLPTGLAIVIKVEEAFGPERTHPLALSLMLGIAYGCSIGGVSTIVGTPTNLAFLRIFEQSFPAAPEISFSEWMVFALPYALVLLIVVWFLLAHVFCRCDSEVSLDREVIRHERARMGPMRTEEKRVLVVFATTVFLWVFRKDLVLGSVVLPGWTRLSETFALIDDATIALAAGLVLFMIPARDEQGKTRLLDGAVFGQLPWGIILLFGGGFALAEGFIQSGLSLHLGAVFQRFSSVPVWLQILVICLVVTFLTELTSNSATLSMLLPVLLSWAAVIQINPLLFAIPATISASMAFMMPIATPPNAVVFGSGRIRMAEMARIGLIINLIAVVLTLLATTTLLPLLGAFSLETFPDWAKP
jgi:sodium-dependent dicarboxylate transporter 2/3/5